MTTALPQHKNTEQSQVIEVDIAILRILNLGFVVDESFNTGETVNLSYALKTDVNVPTESIDFTITSIYRVDEGSEPFLTSNTMTRFLIKDIKRFSNPDKLNSVTLPGGILHSCFSIAFSHARAIQMTNTSGTKFSSLILPIINPVELFNAIMQNSIVEGGNVKF